ncbi:hypothetical protein HPP92_015562 [Vanilla planifolia]|uniref:Uncharacterized protein n=1 Tax=Vanilla planifolia TaxID=51239 RepID=A0A835QI48_VANPL|nr:hypothetical protein HPP92_015562 [Vanilla planifolia]
MLLHILLSSDSREFEFQMSVNQLQKEPITSPADELFYKGNLLPFTSLLACKWLNNSSKTRPGNQKQTLAIHSATSPKPLCSHDSFESCSVSPAPSCYASQELNP